MASVKSIGNRIAPPRFLLFFAVLTAAIPLVLTWLPLDSAVMTGFDLAALAFLLSCLPLLNDEAAKMRKAAQANDANRFVLLIVTLILSLVILAAVTGKLSGKEPLAALDKALVIGTLSLAWIFANTVYALHYAHLFYSRDDGGKDRAGLDFPGKRPEPDYADFIYFSFTLGIALQTSDVCVSSPGIRRIVTLHCVAAFVFNLGVLATAINILSGGG